MAVYDFDLPKQVHINFESPDELLSATIILKEVIMGMTTNHSLPAICDNGEVTIDPNTNNHWLCPPNCKKDTHPRGKWRLIGRYEKPTDLKRYINRWLKAVGA